MSSKRSGAREFRTLASAWLLIGIVAPIAVAQVERRPESEAQVVTSDSKQVGTGRQVFLANCSFCHGASARGGAQGGPDLTSSELVRSDTNGKQLGPFLKVGRPGKGMPAFNLSDTNVEAIAAFLHATIASAPRRQSFGKEVLVGDAAAGKTFFAGDGHCAHCHSPAGDLKGIGSKYPPAALQGRLVLPVGDGGYPGFSAAEAPRVQVTVTAADGKETSGLLVFISDYVITLIDSAGERHTFPRHGDMPKLVVKDPLQVHFDRQLTLTDKQMHDLTAYLAGLK